MEVRRSTPADVPAIFAIVNDAAQVYRGVIPADRWHEPYMPMEELAAGVAFWVYTENSQVAGEMGMQDKGEVALVRHAYTASTAQRKGVGSELLRHIERLTAKPILIGTWADAKWAIAFYQRNGYTVVSHADKEQLLRKYWSIPVRQIDTSVVLADRRWAQGRSS